jgi:uroporphyrinogen decarboxylase
MAALQGKPMERPPFTMTLSLFGAKLIDCPLTEYYRNPERYAEGQDAVVDLCDPDILFAPFALTLEAEAFGSEIIFLPDNPPNIRKPAFRNPEEFMGLHLPDIDDHPSLLYFRESVRHLARKHKGKKPICGVVTAPVDLPALIMGIDMWIETLLFHEHIALAILDKASEHFIRLSNALLSDGADFIALTTVFTHPIILYRKLIDEHILPTLHRSFREVKGPIVFHHGGNPIVPLLNDYLGLPNVAAFAVDHRDSLSEARSIIGPNRLLLGNLNGPNLSRLPVDKILDKVDDILTDRNDDPCFVFSTCAADVPWATQPAAIRAIAEKIRSWEKES